MPRESENGRTYYERDLIILMEIATEPYFA